MKRFLLSLVTCALLLASASADEGMWMPKQLPDIGSKLKAAGLELDPKTMTQLTEFPMNAIVSLGGCTASFVSPQGLVVTNHHCAYGSIQYNSTVQKNLLRDGFLAKTLAEELPAAPGSRVFVTVDVQNVTDKVIDPKTAKLTGKDRTTAIETNQKSVVATCEKDAGHRCTVASFYGGLEYYLIKQLEIRDVRLVHNPPESVGKFGGDTDNWMWPRHTGDYSFYRAYVGKDGKPADYSPENVPYRPKHYLKVAAQGVKEGDFVMVTGYPGRTNRHRLPSEVDFTFGWNYPAFVKASGEQLAIIERETKGRDAAAISYASTVAGINNYYKNRQGMLDSYKGSDLLARKQAAFNALKAWVNADKARQAQYGSDIAAIESLIAERDAITKREFLLGYTSPRLLDSARTLYEFATQKAEPDDMKRKIGFQQRDWPRLRAALEAIDKRYDEQVDKSLARHFLAQYLSLPAADQNAAYVSALGLKPGMSEAEIGAQLDKLYAGSKLADKATRMAWFDRDAAAFKASDDTFIKAAVALADDTKRLDDRDRDLSGKIQQAYANYMKALIAYRNSKGEAVYPDANSTLRVTYGKVAGRTDGNADGTAWTPFTTLRGITAKYTGKGEFDAPATQLAAIKEKKFGKYGVASLDSVPVNYLATLDITGGNSGSPVLNSRAELVGLAFDGTLDSVISDWDFNPATTRTIACDVRYMLWQMEVVDHATNVVNELRGTNVDQPGK
ncbi:MAG TPA: S46 family peptidase [Terriglobales bacterium]|nr:S46 family peptidase [Terriglobales bacterium]